MNPLLWAPPSWGSPSGCWEVALPFDWEWGCESLSLLRAKGIKCSFQLPAIACYWKIYLFFPIPTWTCHIPQPTWSIRSHTGSSLPVHAFSFGGRLPHSRPGCSWRKTLHGPENPIQPPRTSREKGWISPASQGACRVTVSPRHDHGVRPAFEAILRRLQRTRLRTCHYVSLKKNPAFFFLQKQCAACLAVLHKQLLANMWTNIQVKERKRNFSSLLELSTVIIVKKVNFLNNEKASYT